MLIRHTHRVSKIGWAMSHGTIPHLLALSSATIFPDYPLFDQD